MTERRLLFAAESRALRQLADAAPGGGALTLLGGPLLALVATFCVQPNASESASVSSPTSSRTSFAHEAESNIDVGDQPLASEAELDEEVEPFKSIHAALQARDFDRARQLLASAPALRDDPLVERSYELMLECLRAPSNDLMARAYHFYLEEAPPALRTHLSEACLRTP